MKNAPTKSLLPFLRVLRPEQWLKNIIVLAAFFFAYFDKSQRLNECGLLPFVIALIAALVFALASSGVYIFNDLLDKEADRRHPVKCHRPIAAGEISETAAILLSTTIISLSIGIALALSLSFGAIIICYVLMQYLYTAKLKHIALLDVFIIALGFVLRAIAGATVLSVRISPWLLLCTFLLALFLALCKRRQEKVTKKENEQRISLKEYSVGLLDQLIAISASSAVLSYSLYTLSPETIKRFETPLLGLSIPFVIFGIFRYIHLVYVQSEGERPEKTLLNDKVIIITVILFALTIALVKLFR